VETKEFIRISLERQKQATIRVLDGMSQQEIAWRPGPEANSIGIILFHAVRSEDTQINTRLQGKPQLWESAKWYEKLKLPQSETGSGYTAEQCAAFPVPSMQDFMEYAAAVRNQTLEYLNAMNNDAFDRVINLPRLGDITIGAYFALIVVHQAQHAGEVSYLRGLQRGMNK
jgi:hypothetical protein